MNEEDLVAFTVIAILVSSVILGGLVTGRTLGIGEAYEDQEKTIDAENHTLSLDSEGEGTLMVDGEEVSVPYEQDHPEGEKLGLEAVPDAGHNFYRWDGDNEETALVFDGQDDYVDVDFGNYSTSYLEVSVLVKTYSSSNQRILNTPGDESWSLYLYQNQPSVNIYGGDHHNFDTTLERGKWYEVRCVYDNGSVTMQVNGETIGTETLHSGPLEFTDLEFGRQDEEKYLHGGMVEAAVSTGEDSIGNWTLYEGGGGTVNDRSGQGNHGDIIGADWSHVPVNLEFPADDDMVETPYHPEETDLGDGGALSAWINFDTVGTSQYMGSWGDPRLYVGDSGEGNLQTGFGDDYEVVGGNLSIGRWHHLVVTNDGTTTIGYLDGEKIHSYTSSFSGTNDDFLIGDVIGADGIQGCVDEVRIYDRNLTEVEVGDLYQRKHIENGLVAYWPLDQGVGKTIFDESENGHHGDILGAEWSDYPAVTKETREIVMNGDRGLTVEFYQKPKVGTLPAENVTHTGAELHGNITDVDHPDGSEVHFEYKEAGEDWNRTLPVSTDGEFYTSDPVGFSHSNGYAHINEPIEKGESSVFRYHELGSGCDLKPHLRSRSTEKVGGTSSIWEGYTEDIPSGREFEVMVEFNEDSNVNISIDGGSRYSDIDIGDGYEKIYFTSYEYSGSTGEDSLRLLNSKHMDSNGTFSYKLSGLSAGEKYEYRAVTYDDGEKITGEYESFETRSLSAEVDTYPATNITHRGVKLHGELTNLTHPHGAEVHYEYKEAGEDWNRTLPVSTDGEFYTSDPVGFSHSNGYAHINEPIEKGESRVYRYHELGSECDFRPHLRSRHTEEDGGEVFIWSGYVEDIPDVREFEVEVEFNKDSTVNISIDGESRYSGIEVGGDLEEVYFTSYEYSGSSSQDSLRLLNSKQMDSNGTFSYQLSDLSSGTEYEFRAAAYVGGERMIGGNQSFETDSITSEVDTHPATNVTHVGAKLHGELTNLAHPDGAEVYYEYKRTGGDWNRTLQVSTDGDFHTSDPVGFSHSNGYAHINEPIEKGE
ncbi:MAG: LamG-like jellyroll fold domain-containing protein, partial [Candidatus Natronoplasma sp.]